MDKSVQEFLKNHRISALGILQADNTVHSAAMHTAFTTDPLSFLFLTEKNSRKCQPLLAGQAQNASLVIGFSEEELASFQAEGTVGILNGEKLQDAWGIYLERFPERQKRKGNPDYVLLEFTPTWWRYTDMKTNPRTIIENN